MRAPLSIVVPTLNAARSLPATLAALMEGLEAGLVREVVISDGGSEDATLQIAEEVGARVVRGAASRGGQLRRGVDAAQGSWLLILHADTVLSPGWSEAVQNAMRDGRAGYFQLAFDTPRLAGALVAGWANLRARLFALPYGDQGLLVQPQTLAEIGGVPDVPLMEDVLLVRALKPRLLRINATARTSFERYEREGVLLRGLRNLWLLLRFFAGTSPERLARAYRKKG